ncbi:MAG: glycoside hydrolase family 104 protein [Burkholderiaceae bacterium]|nr:glycoside hydrolase family 104 protein [Burkholderiaceae bacterium]
MTRDDLRAALKNPNVTAFLHVIRVGEGTPDAEGYRRMFGGALFFGYADHPRSPQTAKSGSKPITSSAAGAYQFLSKTWDGLVKQWGFSDFSPPTQDEAAIALIVGRKALDDVMAGRIQSAIRKCADEWASLPGSPYGQPTKTLQQAISTYKQAGGILEGEPMTPFIIPALDAILGIVPDLLKVFRGTGSEVAQRNQAAAQVVVEAAKSALGVRNEQELVETIKEGTPETVAAVNAAVRSVWWEISTDSTGIGKARESNIAQSSISPKRNMALWVTVMLLPLVYLVVSAVLFKDGFSDDVRAMTVAAVISGVLGAITGYWLGTSFSSAKKDERAAQ